MKYDFDKVIERKKTRCLKYDGMQNIFGSNDLLPMWVADMDFECPPAIIQALQKRVEQGVLGYPIPGEDYFKIISNWIKKKHNWEVKPEWCTFVPGVVKGLAFILDSFTTIGDNILIQTPVYHPFRMVTEEIGRKIITSPLIENNGVYYMDFNNLEYNFQHHKPKLMILCNPHNPGGRVWSKNELQELASLCERYNIRVISDEIHADLTLSGYKHTSFAHISQWTTDNSFTLMAPSKTFNMAGLISSFIIIPNNDLRNQYRAYVTPRELDRGTIFAYEATRVAFTQCDDWHQEMLNYVEANITYTIDFLSSNIPLIKPMKPNASFLLWLDCRLLNLSHNALIKLFTQEAGLALNDGAMFGSEGNLWMRLNVGTPRSILTQALSALHSAVSNLK